jgi:hypothetical protein
VFLNWGDVIALPRSFRKTNRPLAKHGAAGEGRAIRHRHGCVDGQPFFSRLT